MGQLGDLSPQASVAVGVLVGLVSTSIQSLGLTLQRKSHMLEDEKDVQDVRRPPYKRRRWQLGMFMFIVSNLVGSTIQITTLPLPVLSTLQAAGLVFNSICATLILGEPFTRFSLCGTILVCAGAVLIAVFGAVGEPAHTLDQLLELLGRQEFMIWMTGQAILVVVILAGTRMLKALNPYNNNSPRMRFLRGISYGSISGILSAHSLLVAKSAVELLVQTLGNHKNQFNRWQSWVILLGLLALALTQLFYLHQGLKLCSTSILYPFIFCVYNVIAILDGLIYFDQSSRLSALSAVLIAIGTAILLAGVVCLSWRLNNDSVSNAPSGVQNPLAPGLGCVTGSSDTEASSAHSSVPDEEAALLPRRSRSPFLVRSPNGIPRKLLKHATFADYGSFRGLRHVSDPIAALPSMGTGKPHRSGARLRSKTISAVNEIWGELEEEPALLGANVKTDAFLSQQRATKTQTIPGSRGMLVRSASAHGTAFDGHSSLKSPVGTDESPRPLARSHTGRTYRGRRSEQSAPGTGAVENRTQQPKVQNALGGWWKMKRWWKDDQKSKGRDEDC